MSIEIRTIEWKMVFFYLSQSRHYSATLSHIQALSESNSNNYLDPVKGKGNTFGYQIQFEWLQTVVAKMRMERHQQQIELEPVWSQKDRHSAGLLSVAAIFLRQDQIPERALQELSSPSRRIMMSQLWQWLSVSSSDLILKF